jgi:hypothetical protein
MRSESFEFLGYGALLAVIALAVTWPIASSLLRLHLRAPFVALGLGVIFVPGHGEFIAVPLLAMFRPPIHDELLVIGGFFFVLWWIVAMLGLLGFRAAAGYLQRADSR